jgi:hypothetical protein
MKALTALWKAHALRVEIILSGWRSLGWETPHSKFGNALTEHETQLSGSRGPKTKLAIPGESCPFGIIKIRL